MARPSGRPIRDELIDAACVMVQRVGVNAFSYGDLAKQLDISAPSIHHHFRTKGDLVAEVAAQYRSEFAARRDAIDERCEADLILAYARLFGEASSHELMCFCGAVASEWPTVGEQAQREVAAFFDEQADWLAARLRDGVESGEFIGSVDVARHATTLLATLEGALLLSRASGDSGLAESACADLLDLLRN